MKVLFVLTTFPSSERPKIGSFNLRAAKQISNYVDCTVIVLRAWKPGRELLNYYHYQGLKAIEVALPYLPSASDILKGVFISIYKRWSLYLLKDLISKADVLHSVGISLPGIVCSFWSEKLEIKHIAQAIGTDVNYRIGRLKNYFGVRGWETNISYLVGNSHSLIREFHKHYPNFSSDKLKVIYRGLDYHDFPFSPLPKNLDQITFLYLGGISSDNTIKHGINFKGIVTLLDSWALLLNKLNRNACNFKLLIGGPRTNESEYLKERVEALNALCDSIDIIGELYHYEIHGYLKSSTVVIIPSMAEGLPNIALEALSTGRPTIASSVGGIPELVKHEKNGFLFEAGNKVELASLILYCIENPYLLTGLGLNGRKIIEKDFDANNFIINYLSLYRE